MSTEQPPDQADRAGAASCAACGAAGALRPWLAVAGDAGAQGLIPTTDRFGVALSDLVRCARCGHGQLARMPDASTLAAAYADAASEDYLAEARGQRATARVALERIETAVAPGALVDLGCWVGFLLEEARERGWSVTGVEPSGWAAAQARERLGLTPGAGTAAGPGARQDATAAGQAAQAAGPHATAAGQTARAAGPGATAAGQAARAAGPGGTATGQAVRSRPGAASILHGDLFTADLPAVEFDAAVLGDVLEHLVDPAAALDRIAALLRPGGVVHFALPDAGSRVARVLGARWWSVIPTHLQYFTRGSLATLLSRRGWEPLWIGTAPKAFSVGYYLSRVGGYSPPAGRALVGAARTLGVADRLVAPDFRDRMAVLARPRAVRC